MRKAILGLILGLGLMVWLGVSCTSLDCTTTNTAYVYYVFYDGDGRAVSLSDTITVTAAGTDSVLVNSEVGASMLQLQLSYTNTVDTFVVRYTARMVDSIFVTHSNIPYFISMDCGMGMFHHLESIRSTHNAIDSIIIVDPEIDYEAKENVKIYFADGV